MVLGKAGRAARWHTRPPPRPRCRSGPACGEPPPGRLAWPIRSRRAWLRSLFHDGSVPPVFFSFQISFNSRKFSSAHPDPELAFVSNYFSSAVTCLSRETIDRGPRDPRVCCGPRSRSSIEVLDRGPQQTIDAGIKKTGSIPRHAAVSKPFHPPHPPTPCFLSFGRHPRSAGI